MDNFLEYLHAFVSWWEGLHSNTVDLLLYIAALLLSILAIIGAWFSGLIKWIWSFVWPKPKQEQRDYSELCIKLLEQNSERDQAEIEQLKEQLKKTFDDLQNLQAEAASIGDQTMADQFQQALDFLAEGDSEQAEKLFENIFETKRAEGNRANQQAAEAARHIGALAYYHDTAKALGAYRQSTELDADNADGWNMLGLLLLRTGDLDHAITAFQRVLQLGNQHNDKKLEAIALGHLGVIAHKRGNLDQAEDYHQRSLAIAEELGRKEGMAIQLGNLGLIAETSGDLDQAEDYHLRSLAIAEELGHKDGMANQLGNLGLIAQKRGDLNQAEGFHQRSLDIFEELGHKDGMASQLGNLGAIAQVRGDLDQAEDNFAQAEALFREIGMKPEIEKTQQLRQELAELRKKPT